MGLTAATGRPTARTLAESLRAAGEDQLVDLLTRRPDLGSPPPADIGELASRASTTASVARAVDRLPAFDRLVAEALAALPAPATTEAVAALLDTDLTPVRRSIAGLRAAALLWGPDEQLHLVRAVREAFGPYPGGLAPPSPNPRSPEQIESALGSCDESVRPVLDRLLWSPAGAVRKADRTVDPASARSAVDQLLATGLLRPLTTDTVLLPREVALHLRGGRFTAEPVSPDPPALAGAANDPARVDAAAAGTAYELVHEVEVAVELLEQAPHRLVRTGGLASRDLAALARSLGVSQPQATFVLECAAAAGLIGVGGRGRILPTEGYDHWLTREPAERWLALARAWVAAPRQFARSEAAGAHALGPEAGAPWVADLRALLLELAAAAAPGTVLDPTALTTCLAWHRPRAQQAAFELGEFVEEIWGEAGRLGLVALAAVSSYLAAALDVEHPLPSALAERFPQPVDRLILQADLTAVAPGPLPATLGRELRLLADQESRGGGGVYRFSPASLHRALDAGWSADRIGDWLRQHSLTEVPQPLTYLVTDLARRSSALRVSAAASVVHADPTQTAALLAAPQARDLELREVAPGLLVSTADPDEVVEILRSLGHRPAAEDGQGRTLVPPDPLRAPAPLLDPPSEPAPQSPARVAQLLRRRQQPEAGTPATDPHLQLLWTATQDAQPVRLSYVAADGTPTERELCPLDLADGIIRVVDRSTARVLTIPLARIRSVTAVAGAQ